MRPKQQIKYKDKRKRALDKEEDRGNSVGDREDKNEQKDKEENRICPEDWQRHRQERSALRGSSHISKTIIFYTLFVASYSLVGYIDK